MSADSEVQAGTSQRKPSDDFLCFYCGKGYTYFEDVITHTQLEHSADNIKVRIKSVSERTGKEGYQSKSWNIVPKDVTASGHVIMPSPDLCLRVIKSLPVEENECTEPSPKKQKVEVNEECIESQNQMLIELQRLMPLVLQNIRDSGRLETFAKFIKLVSEGTFPFKNIAWLLFLDVIEFYSCENTKSMNYKEDATTLFWRTGYKLMHGKFLRYCGGLKNRGQRGNDCYSPQDADINFAVPDLKTLQKKIPENSILDADVKPGILSKVIDQFTENGGERTYKICVDGKKINSCTDDPSGEVNLFGFEGPPTVEDKEARLKNELSIIEEFRTFLENIEVKTQSTVMSNYDEESKNACRELALQLINIFSKRIQDMRELRVKKDVALMQFKQKSGTDWRKSKFALVISHIQTWLFQCDDCIKSMLNAIDNLSKMVSTIFGVCHLYHGPVVDLNSQENYMCLQESTREHTQTVIPIADTPLVKQRSDTWFYVRSTAPVTGSTAYKALGLDTLKAQQDHFDRVFCKKEKQELPDSLKAKMKHGQDSEIHCVATLVSKVLPVLCPDLRYREEGCYTVQRHDKTLLISSPDGTCVDNSQHAVFACEFKCPVPDNIRAKPVHYNVPVYYAPQILAEMNTTDTEELLYLSYSEQSTTVLRVRNDRNLWENICDELESIYLANPPKRPTRKSQTKENLKTKLKCFLDESTTFVGEFPSAKATPCRCNHTDSTESEKPGRNAVGQHMKHERGDLNITVQETTLGDIQSVAYQMNRLLENSATLSRHQASEILVYILSDLDRNRDAQRPHAVPIGYALKGFGLSVATFRKMLLHTLKIVNQSAYCPITCFDGQWFPIVARDTNDKPLTIIQLQKDVFREVKACSKQKLLKDIREYHGHEKNNQPRIESCKLKTPDAYLKMVAGQRMSSIITEDEDIGNDGCTTDNALTEIIPNQVLTENVFEDVLHMEEELSDLQCQPSTNAENPDAAKEEDGETSTAPCGNEECLQYTDEDFERMFLSLNTDGKRQSVWIHKSFDEFKTIFNSADLVKKHMLKPDIIICLRAVKPKLKVSNWKTTDRKEVLMKVLFGHPFDTDSPNEKVKSISHTANRMKSLKDLCWGIVEPVVKKQYKDSLITLVCQMKYRDRLFNYRMRAPFQDTIVVKPLACPIVWFSQPEFIEDMNLYHFSFIDPTHILTNLRSKICTTGIEARGLYQKQWVRVAKECDINGSGLNLSLIEAVADKQNVGFAMKVFSQEVENALRNNGADTEAQFCYVLRRWYEAEDNRGISVEERCVRRLAMREWLLEGVDIENFEYYGRYVRGIPIVTFESLLINIDRRLQLYPFTCNGTYNVRTIGSLENEEFFGEFHELDPRNIGLLNPKDIGKVMHTSLELLSTRLNQDRGFCMPQSSRRSYPVHEQDDAVHDNQHELPQWKGQPDPRFLKEIVPKGHMFDRQRTGKARRKSGIISKPTMAAKGAHPVRQYFKVDESKIPAHVRANLDID